MKRLSAFALLCGVVVGCGGGSDAPPGLPGSAFRQTKIIGPSGDTVSSDAHLIGVEAPANALVQSSPVTLEVFHAPTPGAARPGFKVSEHQTQVTVVPAHLGPEASLRIKLPFADQFDELGTMMFVARSDGLAVPLRVAASGGQLIGTLKRGHLQALGVDPASQEPYTFNVFTAQIVDPSNALALPPPLITSIMKYDASSNQFVGLQQNDTMQGKRVAFLVHGVASELNDLVNLANYLATGVTTTSNGQQTPYYDEVWGFQYTSNAPLAEIGQVFAQFAQPYMAQAKSVDLLAHSMGNLVSRYAMETPSLGTSRLSAQIVQHFVGLGGPHEGVPFEVAQDLLFFIAPSLKPCISDLTTHSIDAGFPLFLTNLNTPTSPDFATAKYYTDAGSDYSAEEPPEGDIINAAYFVANGFSHLTNDGLVAQYSALSLMQSVLATKSAFWQSVAISSGWPTLPVSHAELKGAPGGCTSQNPGSGQCIMIATLKPWIDSWITANGLTPG